VFHLFFRLVLHMRGPMVYPFSLSKHDHFYDFTIFTDKDVKLHFAFERFLANQIREAFGFIGSPIWFKTRPRNKKKPEE
jgi:predicted GTPase